MTEASEHGNPLPEGQSPRRRVDVPYDVYARQYDHYRLRLQTTFACASETHDPETTQRLLRLEAINRQAGANQFYASARLDRVHPESTLPFRLSPEPFRMPDELRNDLPVYGEAVAAYYRSCRSLITDLPRDHRWKKYLGHHKPSYMTESLGGDSRNHAFLRPDFILTDGAPAVTEIETSPFGLALSHFLTSAYGSAGTQTLTDASALPPAFLKNVLGEEYEGKRLAIAITEHTKAYQGQLKYFAEVLRSHGVNAEVTFAEELQTSGDSVLHRGERVDGVYRGFYLHEALGDPQLETLLRSGSNVFPPAHAMLEEKAMMGMLSDEELSPYFREHLGERTMQVLARIIPRTWVLDPNLPPPTNTGLQQWTDLAAMNKTQRQFVLKTSGFSPESSWSRSVQFLGRLSHERCRETIEHAQSDEANLYVIQEFRKGSDFKQPYFDFHEHCMKTMRGRVRLTPYYDANDGRLLTAKATICENTDFIHGMIDSVNVPVV